MSDSGATFSKVVSNRNVRVIDESGASIADVEIVRIASNGTYLDGRSDNQGTWSYLEPFLGTVTILVAGPGWDGAVGVLEVDEWSDTLEITLAPVESGGSLIISNGTGYVPGLNGRLNPIRDSQGRTYIYGDNLSFEESPDQPFRFTVDGEFQASDAQGNAFGLTVLGILGRTSLIRYRQRRATPLEQPHS